MKTQQALILLILLGTTTALAMSPLPDLNYPDATAQGEIKHQSYDKMAFWIKGTGYVSVYGSTVSQKFKHPTKLGNECDSLVEAFFTTQLGLTNPQFLDGFLQFNQGQDHYYLKLSTYSTSYSYTLLREVPCPEIVTLPVEGEYQLKQGKDFNFPKHELIPNVDGFVLSVVKYFEYDEIDFFYDRGRFAHKGQYWKIDFSKVADNKDSYRYMVAHDYKRKLKVLGAEILDDEDNNFVFKLGNTVASFGSYDTSFSFKIIQEESFEQSLVLTPDAIKTELDKTGKITLDGIHFDFNKATLKPESQKAVLSTVALMQRYNDLVLSVHGHTDNKGSDTYNAQLSSDRAAAVMGAIVNHGISAERLQSKGHGEEDPIASNDTDEGRAQNRRVELHKESGGNQQSIITIDFIKPIENSVVTENYTYQDDALGIQYTRDYGPENVYKEYSGTHEKISYEIIKEEKRNTAFSRKAIIKNYENILELYNATIVGNESNSLYFEIADRGDGKKVYGRIEGYDGSYTIRFLIPED